MIFEYASLGATLVTVSVVARAGVVQRRTVLARRRTWADLLERIQAGEELDDALAVTGAEDAEGYMEWYCEGGMAYVWEADKHQVPRV